MNNNSPDMEYVILETVYDSSQSRIPLRQRDLAQIAGTSLGMTNVILKRLVLKGWITVKKLNSRNIQYAVTLAGMNEIIHRSYGYFKRTIKNVVFFKERIEESIYQAKENNISAVLLIGESDLEFIVEHFCNRHGLQFLKTGDENTARGLLGGNTLAVYAETFPVPQNQPEKNDLFLSRMVIGKTVTA